MNQESKRGDNTSDYYQRISQIRAKILSRHKNGPDSTFKPKKNYDGQNEVFQKKYEKIYTSQKFNGQTIARKPLEIASNNIDGRIKDIETINDRIKSALSKKKNNHIQLQASQKPVQYYGKNYEYNSLNKQILTNRAVKIQEQDNGQLLRKNKASKLISLKDLQHSVSLEYLEKSKKSALLKSQQTNLDLKKDRQVKMINELTPHFFKSINQEQKRVEESKTQFKFDHSLTIKSSKKETEKLIKLLASQIKFDISLRQMRQKFENLRQKDKWSLLKEESKKNNLILTDFEIESWIKITAQQHNPFSEISNDKSFSYAEIVFRLKQAKAHWNNSLKQCVKIQNLQAQAFNIREIDLGNKGYLRIQDFVCFLNLYSNSCFRNRDLCSLFRRLSSNQQSISLSKIKYETFLNYVAQ